MQGCDGCRNLLLEYLYDLLDEGERRDLEGHLTGCAACQSALVTARAQQQRLAVAARLSFPQVVFTTPAPEPVTILLPVRPRLKQRRFPIRWAVAAAILLALGGIAVPGYRAAQHYTAARDEVIRHEQALAEATKKVNTIRAERNQVAIRHNTRVKEMKEAINARQIQLIVTGPSAVQQGVTTDFQVRALDLEKNPTEARLSARLISEVEGKEKDAGKNLDVASLGKGLYRVRIPSTMRLPSGVPLNMLVLANRGRGEPVPGSALTLKGKVQLTSPVFLTHLATDRLIYKPGDVVRFRSLTLDRRTLTPAGDEFRLIYTLTSPDRNPRIILSGSSNLARVNANKLVEAVKGPDGKPVKGIGVGEYALPTNAKGGDYVLTVSEERDRFPPQQTRFRVRQREVALLAKRLTFNKNAYAPGTQVDAVASAVRRDGAPVKNQPVDVTLSIDNRTYNAKGLPAPGPFRAKTNDKGQAEFRFQLPSTIPQGQASVKVQFQDEKRSEAIERPIPLVLNNVAVEFFPEGGDLVAGIPNRVYFQARTPQNTPIDITGVLLENGKMLPVTVKTLSDASHPGINQGLGVFTFTPAAGRKYELRISRPAGIREKIPLPAVRSEGVVLSVPGGVFEAKDEIRVVVRGTGNRHLLVALYCRDELLETAQIPAGKSEVVLKPSSDQGGVCRLTVFEEINRGNNQRGLRPVAERLIFRHPGRRIDVTVSSQQKHTVAGQTVKLNLSTTDESERLKATVVQASVVDRRGLGEGRLRGMPAHFLLTAEIRKPEDLENADFLLGSHPKASEALDLLLGTQGWRRFAEQSPDEFATRLARGDHDPVDGKRLLYLIGQSPRVTNFDKEEFKRIDREFNRDYQPLEDKIQAAEAELNRAEDSEPYRAALSSLSEMEARWAELRRLGVFLLATLGAFLVAVGLVRIVARNSRPTFWVWGGAVACALLLVVVFRQGSPDSHRETRPREVAIRDATPNRVVPDDDDPVLQSKAEQKKEADEKQGGVKSPARGGFAPGAGRGGRMGADAGFGATRPTEGNSAMQPALPPALGGDAKKTKMIRGPVAGKGGSNAPAPRPTPPVPSSTAKVKPDSVPGKPGEPAKEAIADLRLRQAADRYLRNPTKDSDKAAQSRATNALPLLVRSYANVRQASEAKGDSSLFGPTLCWQPVLILPSGEAIVSFEADQPGIIEVIVYAHTVDGRLGAAVKRIVVGKPGK